MGNKNTLTKRQQDFVNDLLSFMETTGDEEGCAGTDQPYKPAVVQSLVKKGIIEDYCQSDLDSPTPGTYYYTCFFDYSLVKQYGKK